AAVEAWISRDHDAEWQTWLSWMDTIAKKVKEIDGVTTEVQQPTNGLNNRCPRLVISWDPNKLNISGDDLAEELARNAPRVAIGSGGDEKLTSVNITPSQMRPGNDKTVANRIHGVLSQKRPPRTLELKSPSVNVGDRWEVTVKFFSSESKHTLLLEQDGNWVQGLHQGDFSVREVVGMVEGDVVKLRSVDSQSGDSITFIFTGTVTGETMSGSVFMGEYLTAEFSAKRNNTYKNARQRVVVPGGPPLAT
ncbi:MAG: selenocysteine synthase, partial [Cyclobacteriaceae bacterium]|nr:selenocysteine synthase [Cyclobacteriaceae bacterium]